MPYIETKDEDYNQEMHDYYASYLEDQADYNMVEQLNWIKQQPSKLQSVSSTLTSITKIEQNEDNSNNSIIMVARLDAIQNKYEY